MKKLLTVLLLVLAVPNWASTTRSLRVWDTMFVSVGGVGFPPYAADPWTCDAFTMRATYYNTTDNKVYYCNGTAWGTMGIAVAAGSGTANRLVKFTAGPALSDSSIIDTGALISVSNNVTINGNADEVQLWVMGNATQTNPVFVVEDSAGDDRVAVRTPATSGATVGTNLVLTNSDFASLDFTGWTATAGAGTWDAATGAAVRTAGAGGTLVQAITVTTGEAYLVTWTATVTASNYTVAIGAAVTQSLVMTTGRVILVAAATGAVNFTITPSATFAGSFDTFTVQLITPAVPTLSVLNSDGSTGNYVYSGGIGLRNTYFGSGAGQGTVAGTDNVAIGLDALKGADSNFNTAVGAWAMDAFRQGITAAGASNVGYNSAFGAHSLSVSTTGFANSAFGYGSGALATTGYGNSTFGFQAYTNAAGYNNNCFGYACSIGGTAVSSTALGSNISVSGTNTVAVGDTVLSTGTGANNTLIGKGIVVSATGNPSNNTIIGAVGAVAASADYCVGLGAYANCALDNSLVVGDDQANYQVSSAYFGEGYSSTSAIADKSFVMRATGGSGADNQGGNFYIGAGLGTGAAVPARVIINQATPIGTGAVPQTDTEVASFGYANADGTSNFATFTGTFPTTRTGWGVGATFNFTGAGNSAQAIIGVNSVLYAGYTGAAETAGLRFWNLSAGTAKNLEFDAAPADPLGNIGIYGIADSDANALNVGVYGGAINTTASSVGIGVVGYGDGVAGSIGVLGYGGTAGTGGWFTLDNTDGVAGITEVNAALLADNHDIVAPIILGRHNGTTTFEVEAEGGTFLRKPVIVIDAADADDDYTLTSAQYNALVTNTGDNDGLAIHLPEDPTAGAQFTIAITAAQTVTITTGTNEDLYNGADICVASITSNTVGTILTLTSVIGGDDGDWFVTSVVGTIVCND